MFFVKGQIVNILGCSSHVALLFHILIYLLTYLYHLLKMERPFTVHLLQWNSLGADFGPWVGCSWLTLVLPDHWLLAYRSVHEFTRLGFAQWSPYFPHRSELAKAGNETWNGDGEKNPRPPQVRALTTALCEFRAALARVMLLTSETSEHLKRGWFKLSVLQV